MESTQTIASADGVPQEAVIAAYRVLSKVKRLRAQGYLPTDVARFAGEAAAAEHAVLRCAIDREKFFALIRWW